MPLNPTRQNIQDRLVNTVNATAKRLRESRPGQMTPTAWIAPALLNSWINFGGSDAIAGYYIDGANIVHLKGKIKAGTVTSAAFTLPVGYRPSENLLFAVPSNDAFGIVKIDTSGNVTPTIGNNTYVDLASIHFRV